MVSRSRSPRRPLRHEEASSAEETAGVRGVGALKPMMSVVTLLAVVDMAALASIDTASSVVGDTEAACALPKLSFHLDGFLTGTEEGRGGTGGMYAVGAADRFSFESVDAVEIDLGGPLGGVQSAVGTAYIEGGSLGAERRESDVALEPLVEEDLMDEGLCVLPEALDARLISRAKDCEAIANVVNVSSGFASLIDAGPLPLRAPRLRRLPVDVEREVIPAGVRSSSSSSISFSFSS